MTFLNLLQLAPQNLLVEIITLRCLHNICLSQVWITLLTVSTPLYDLEIVELSLLYYAKYAILVHSVCDAKSESVSLQKKACSNATSLLVLIVWIHLALVHYTHKDHVIVPCLLLWIWESQCFQHRWNNYNHMHKKHTESMHKKDHPPLLSDKHIRYRFQNISVVVTKLHHLFFLPFFHLNGRMSSFIQRWFAPIYACLILCVLGSSECLCELKWGW